MDTPDTRPVRIQERLRTLFLDVLFPKAAPAEVLLFFTLVYAHLASHHAAIREWVAECFGNGWDAFLMPFQGGLEGVGDLFVVLGGLMNFLLVLWMLLLVFLALLFPLAPALIMGFSSSSERKKEKDFGAAAMSLFYLLTSVFTGYLLYLHIMVSRVFEPGSVWESLQYGILWVFFLRQIACGVATLPFMDWDDPWAQEVMASRVRDHDAPWPAIVLGLIAGVVLYIDMRSTYAVGARAVMFAFIYADILLYVSDGLFSRIPALSARRPTSRREPKAAGGAPLRRPRRPRKAVSSPQRTNAECPACGRTWRVEETDRLSRGGYVPCPACKARLVPIEKPA